MHKEDLECILDWALDWLENRRNRERIEGLIVEILDSVKETRREFLGPAEDIPESIKEELRKRRHKGENL